MRLDSHLTRLQRARAGRWLLAAALCVPLSAAAGFFDARDDAMVKERCAKEGKVIGAPKVTDGLFEGVPPASGLGPFHQAARHLLERRFRYVEYQRKRIDPTPPPYGLRFYNQFHEDLLGSERDEKYVRIWVAREGDARCEPFKRFMSSNVIDAHQLRWWGLPHGMCLAVERTNELKAPVEHIYVPDTKATRRGLPRRGWLRYQERTSGQVVAQLWTGASRNVSCFDAAEQRKLDALVTSRGNPDLPDPPPIARVERPQFPARRVAVMVRMGPEARPAPRKPGFGAPQLDYGNWSLPGVLMDHGNTYLSPFYAQSDGPVSGREGAVGVAGYHLYVVRPGLRRQIPIADGALNFTTCGGLSRLGDVIGVVCDSRQEVEDGEKWIWSNWLLLYADDGSPRGHIQFDLTREPFAHLQWQRPIFIRDAKPLSDGRLQATVQYQRHDGAARRTYQVDATFRLDKVD